MSTIADETFINTTYAVFVYSQIPFPHLTTTDQPSQAGEPLSTFATGESLTKDTSSTTATVGRYKLTLTHGRSTTTKASKSATLYASNIFTRFGTCSSILHESCRARQTPISTRSTYTILKSTSIPQRLSTPLPPPQTRTTSRSTDTATAPSHGLNRGSKASIGVGAGLGALVLVLVFPFLLLRRRRRRRGHRHSRQHGQVPEKSGEPTSDLPVTLQGGTPVQLTSAEKEAGLIDKEKSLPTPNENPTAAEVGKDAETDKELGCEVTLEDW